MVTRKKVNRNNASNDLKALLLIFVCLVINLLCGKIAGWTGIPFYFDCIGTILAAMVGGFLPAVVVGFFTNIISSIGPGNETNIYYGVISVLIALCAAAFAQKGTLRKLTPGFIIPVLYFMLIGGGLGSVITWGLYGNTMGEELASSLASRIYEHVGNAFLAQLYAGLIIDLPDKLISTVAAFLLYKGYPNEWRPRRNEVDVAMLTKKRRGRHRKLGLSLSSKISVSVTVIFIVAAMVVAYVSFGQFRSTMIEQEERYATDVATYAASMIDGDRSVHRSRT